MVVIKVHVTYECVRCDLNYKLHFTPTSKEIEGCLLAMDHGKYCTACGGPMKLKHAVFQTLEDECGDDSFGEWRCPYHPQRIYYPIPLRRTLRSKNLNTFYSTLDKYINIVRQGYPWKCPHCGQPMAYTDTRESRYEV